MKILQILPITIFRIQNFKFSFEKVYSLFPLTPIKVLTANTLIGHLVIYHFNFEAPGYYCKLFQKFQQKYDQINTHPRFFSFFFNLMRIALRKINEPLFQIILKNDSLELLTLKTITI